MKIAFYLSITAMILLFSSCAAGPAPLQTKPDAGRQEEVPVLYGAGNTAGWMLSPITSLPEPPVNLIYYRVYPYTGRFFKVSLDLSKKMLDPELKSNDKKTVAKTVKTTEKNKKTPVADAQKKQPEPRKETEAIAAVKKSNPAVTKETTVPRETLQTVENPEVREVFARPGDDIEINFDKSGWYFTGFSKPADLQGVNFVKREVTNKETNFSFKAIKMGDYSLKFNFQDNTGGKKYEENVLLKVLTDRDFSSAMDGMESGKLAGNEEINRADELFMSGKYSQAIETYLKNYKETSPLLNEKIATAYMKTRDFPRAADFWKKNLDAGQDYRSNALRNLVALSVVLDDPDNAGKFGTLLFQDKSENSQTDLLSLIRYMLKKERTRDARDLLTAYQLNYPDSRSLDEVFYLLGRLYEKDTQFRDFIKSKEYYSRVVNEFPGSSYVKDSVDRIQYLNRYVFFIR